MHQDLFPASSQSVILIVEDSLDFAKLAEELLKDAGPGRFRLCHSTRLSDAFVRLAQGGVDLVLLDLNLPDSRGLSTLKKVRAAAPGMPIIVLTGDDMEQTVTAAMKEGAQDYLVKSEFGSDCLIRSIRYSIERQKAVVALQELETRLRQSQKMDAMGRLAGGLAHDFNNLLTAILGYCRLLEESMRPDDERRKDLQEIADNSERAASLTRQLLAFSRRQVLALKVLDLNRTLAPMERVLRRLIGEDIRLSVSFDRGLGNVRADEGQIQQVVMNLVLNARDAMPNGGRIAVETKAARFGEDSRGRHDVIPAGDYAVISVSDSGCGMDAETQAHIFEPFFTTKPQGKGTGLGLSTVYGIVKQSGGYVEVRSGVGRGSTFKVYFPTTAERADETVSAASPDVFRGSESILLAEDDASVRRMLMRVLSGNGYEVIEAGDGREAIRLIERSAGRIHLVLTDVVMPELGGRGLADYVNSRCPQTKVIFMSGYNDDVVLRHGSLDPRNMFIQKPITADALLRNIRSALDAKSARAA